MPPKDRILVSTLASSGSRDGWMWRGLPVGRVDGWSRFLIICQLLMVIALIFRKGLLHGVSGPRPEKNEQGGNEGIRGVPESTRKDLRDWSGWNH
jgi:hypothetical protein